MESVFSRRFVCCEKSLVNDWDDRVSSDLWKVPTFVDVLVDLADDRDVVAAEDVKAEHNLFNSSRCRENSFVGVFENDVDGLIESLQSSDEIPAVGRDDRHHSIHVILQRRRHLSRSKNI